MKSDEIKGKKPPFVHVHLFLHNLELIIACEPTAAQENLLAHANNVMEMITQGEEADTREADVWYEVFVMCAASAESECERARGLVRNWVSAHEILN